MVLLSAMAAPPVLAADQTDIWALCRPLPSVDLPDIGPEGAGLRLLADEAFIDRRGLSNFSGNALLSESGRQLRADQITYREDPRTASAYGAVIYRDESLTVEGDEAQLDLDTGRGAFGSAVYRLLRHHAHGNASRIERLGPGLARLEDATYTTCDPDNVSWQLRAGEVHLDHDEGVGVARNVVMRLGDIPIFYTPYVSFPIDDRRKSGLLSPMVGSTDNGGTDIDIPYYWNIAPHRDATLGPRILSDRGVMFRGEFRYLNSDNGGIVNLEYLADDDLHGNDRHLFILKHQGRLSPRLDVDIDIDINTVSDADYFRDFGNSLSVASITHLERRADLRLRGNGWDLLGRAQSFQTLDRTIAATDRPYQRLPQLLFTGKWPQRDAALPTEIGLRAEWVSFERSDSVAGQRIDVIPSISLPYGGLGWHFTPTLKYRHTSYQLDGTASNAETRPTRNLPIFSVDAGLAFERTLGEGRFQTLEPRVFYLNVPHENQDDIPLFDTGLRDFNFTQMFLDNRFSGADRVGDANQIATVLTTRVIDGIGGVELIRAGIGQIYYFSDRDVTLNPDDPAVTDDESSLIAEGMVRLSPQLSTGAAVRWSPNRKETELAAAWLRYRDGGNRVANLSYRFRENDLEQTDFSAAWPLSPQWRAVARWNYSLREERDIEAFAGFEYESCCWRFRTVLRRYLIDGSDEYNDAIYFQLILKGLTSIGPRIDNLLEEGILGYESD